MLFLPVLMSLYGNCTYLGMNLLYSDNDLLILYGVMWMNVGADNI
jgi:hypothetical protein